MLEGTPNKQMNESTIQWAMDNARRDSISLGDPYLIEPERRDFLRDPGDMQTVVDRQCDRPLEMRHIPEWLPQIECIGVFRSIPAARNKSKDASSLTIVWYQDEFGFDPRAVIQLRSLDWEKHATDFDYY